MSVPVGFFGLLIREKELTESEKDYVAEVYREYGCDKMYELVKAKKIIPFAAKHFYLLGLDTPFWQNEYEQYRSRNDGILRFLVEAYAALWECGVRKMFVSENFGALLRSNGDLALFSSGDVDNFAPAEEKEKIYTALTGIGCKMKERFSQRHQIAAEFFPAEDRNLPKDFYLSVDFYPLARLKLPCFINADDFINWNGLDFYRDTKIRLPQADELLYICLLHISLHSFSRAPDIRLYIDLANLCTVKHDEEKLCRWCERDGTVTRAAVAATIANELMKTTFSAQLCSGGKNRERLLHEVYDGEKKDLIYEPHGLKILQIELLCDDRGTLHGLNGIMFPGKSWMKETYGSAGIAAHFKHFFNVL